MNDYVYLSAERVIQRPVGQVWAVVSDYRRDVEWRTGVSEMWSTCDPVAPGAETTETIKVGGRTYRNRGVVDEVTDQRMLAWHTTEGAQAFGRRLTDGIEGGATRVRLELAVRPRRVERLLAPILRRMLQRNLERDLARLADLVAVEPSESRAQPVAASPS